MTEPTEGAPYRAGYEKIERIIVTTGNDVAGHQIASYLAIVRGIVVRSPGFGKTFLGSFRALPAGNAKELSDVCEAAHHEASHQMIPPPTDLGADAIIGILYRAPGFGQGTTEVPASGTA